jgi:hypothetical protein
MRTSLASGARYVAAAGGGKRCRGHVGRRLCADTVLVAVAVSVSVGIGVAVNVCLTVAVFETGGVQCSRLFFSS